MIKINNYIAGIQELVPCLKYWLDTFYYDLKSIIVIQLEKIERFFFFSRSVSWKSKHHFRDKKNNEVFFVFYTVSFANQVFPFAFLSKQFSFSVERNVAEFEIRITWYNV